MHPFTKLLLLLALIVLVFWLVTKFRDSSRSDRGGAPVPVSDLPPTVQQSIDHALAEGKKINAVKLYRDATRAPLAQAKQAIDAREWQRGS